jgi:hypothetical protein
MDDSVSIIAVVFPADVDRLQYNDIVLKAKDTFKDLPDVRIHMAINDAAETISFFLNNGELPGEADDADDDNLVKHAMRELELLGEDPDMVKGYLDMIKIFSKMEHSGGSASVFIPTLNALLQFKNLKPLTDDPNEWMEVDGATETRSAVHQSRRNGEAFSPDGGKHYYLLSEGAHFANPEPLHETVSHIRTEGGEGGT